MFLPEKVIFEDNLKLFRKKFCLWRIGHSIHVYIVMGIMFPWETIKFAFISISIKIVDQGYQTYCNQTFS